MIEAIDSPGNKPNDYDGWRSGCEGWSVGSGGFNLCDMKTYESIQDLINKFWKHTPTEKRVYSDVLISEVAKSHSDQQLAAFKEKLKKEIIDGFDGMIIDEIIELIDQL